METIANADSNSAQDIINENMETVERLIKTFPNNSICLGGAGKSVWTFLHSASKRGDTDVFERLLVAGADINARDSRDRTPLLCATDSGNLDIVEILLTLGANVNAAQKDGATALHVATKKGHSTIVEMLLEYGANIDAADKYGRTALHFASLYARIEITELLLAHGADVNAMCKGKLTAISYANHPRAYANIHSEEMPRSVIRRFKDFYNLCNYRQIDEILRTHIMKMLVLGLFVSEQNVGRIDVEEEYQECYDDYDREIDLMRLQKIGNSKVSFYEILRNNIHQVTKYAAHRMIKPILDTEEYRAMFPLYSNMIAGSFRRGLRRKQLLHSSVAALDYFVGYRLPNIVSTNILQFLDNKELHNLKTASYNK